MVLSKDVKIAICFGLIMGAIISICNMCFAAETLEPTLVENISFQGATNGHFVSYSGRAIGYFELLPGYKYTITNTSGTRAIGFSNDIPAINVDYYNRFTIGSGESISFTYSDFQYIYFEVLSPGSATIYREPLARYD